MSGPAPAAWVVFLAEHPDRIERVLSQHRRGAGEWCGRCEQRWPCSIAESALAARQLLETDD